MQAVPANASMTPEQLATFRANPAMTRRMLDLADAGEHLVTFLDALWHNLEPGTPFKRGWAIDAICEHLEAVSKKQIRRLLINVSPGFAKSWCVNVAWPAWEWGPQNRPWERYVAASYSQKLMLRDNVRCRRLLLSEDYQLGWGDRFSLSDDVNTKERFENSRTGWKLAAASGSVTGERGTRFVIDDPHSVSSAESEQESETTIDWFLHTVPTRLSDPELDPIVIIMQRLTENDVSAHALELGYEHLCIPMRYEENHRFKSRTFLHFVDPRKEEGELAFPERFPEHAVIELEDTFRKKGGDYAVAGQLQQDPIPKGGGQIKEKDIKIWTGPPPTEGIVVRRWDIAGSTKKRADWTVGLRARRVPSFGLVVEDVRRERLGPGDVKSLIVITAEVDGHEVKIGIPKDPAAAGLYAANDLIDALFGYDVSLEEESGDKEVRFRPVASIAKAGHLWILPGPWNAEFIREITRFPKAAHDDQADALSGASMMLAEAKPVLIGMAPRRIRRKDDDEE